MILSKFKENCYKAYCICLKQNYSPSTTAKISQWITKQKNQTENQLALREDWEKSGFCLGLLH